MKTNQLPRIINSGTKRLMKPFQKLPRLKSLTSLSTTKSSGEFIWKPFVVPYASSTTPTTATKMSAVETSRNVKSNTSMVQEMQLLPRLVSYFEVTILPPDFAVSPQRQQRQGASWQHFHRNLQLAEEMAANNIAECVAVGVALNDIFPLAVRMPGWDSSSFGYHGDDGKIYHGASQHRVGHSDWPKFGIHDTIGCGIDYQHRSIFFTLNGNFLGYAFENISIELLSTYDFYPVIGIDTRCPVRCNFGLQSDAAFQFDLTSYILMNQKDVLLRTLVPMQKLISI